MEERLNEWRRTLPPWAKPWIASLAAGGIADTVVSPLDRIRLLMQTKDDYSKAGIRGSYSKLFKTAGLRGIFMSTETLMGVVPRTTLSFVLYEHYKGILKKEIPSIQKEEKVLDLMSGMLSGATASALVYPLTLARVHMACNVRMRKESDTYKGMLRYLKKTHSRHGLKGLYRGLVPEIITQSALTGVKFLVFESVHKQIPQAYKDSDLTLLGVGAIAGLSSQGILYPLEALKSKLQVREDTTATKVILQGISSTDALKRQYSGLSLNSIKTVAHVAVSFYVYETMKRLLEMKKEE